MLNRFKNKLVNIVGGISNQQGKDSEASSPSLPQDVCPFPYSRPDFLHLCPEEVQVSADHVSRPILVPRNGSGLPWNAGYAEVINAGKTKVNEDQAKSEVLFIPKQNKSESTEDIINGELNEDGSNDNTMETIPLHYFAVFDGHAGTGASLMAVNILHLIIQDKLLEIKDLVQAHLDGKYQMVGGSSPESPNSQVPVSPVTPPFSPPPDLSPSNTDHSTPNISSDDDLSPKSSENLPDLVHDSDTLETEDTNKSLSTKTVDEKGDCLEGSPEAEETKTDQVISTSESCEDSGKKESHVNGPPTVQETDPSVDPVVQQKSESESQEGAGGVKRVISMDAIIPPPRYGMALALHRFSLDSLIQGALESSFFDMDGVIARERRVYRIPGGCTAVAAIFFNGKLYVTNAGDSRAIVSFNGKVMPMSHDFTPETDRERIQMMAWHHPELLGGMFSATQFAHRVSKKDVGKRVLHRDGWRKGWSYKTVSEEDLQMPLIYGEGKKARLLGTIGVSRGFGDHDLRVYESDVYVKPFMTCAPQVCILDLADTNTTADDVLIIATDGLWDVTSNDKAASIVKTCLDQFNPDDPSRYVSAAQELVMHARGVNKGGPWRTADDRMASGDDITVFVIPLNCHDSIISQSSSTESTHQHS